jgi:aldose 1-epimerase
MTASDDIVTRRLGAFELEIAPRFGAAVCALRWRDSTDRSHDLLRPASAAGRAGSSPEAVSMFLMAPFCNRIDGGRFTLGGKTIQLAINLPQENVAIHGFVRDLAWQLAEEKETDIAFTCERDAGSDPYRFRARLAARAASDAFSFTLSLQSTTDVLLPYGLGFHPYFHHAPDMTAAFWAAGVFEIGARGLPLQAAPSRAPLGTGRPAPLPGAAPYELHFGHWDREAILTWPSEGLELTMTGSEPFKNLQFYIPADRSACCVEPMTHLTDVVNRPVFAQWGHMETLGRGGVLTASMTLAPRLIAR